MGHTAFQLDRRAFLKAGLTGAAALTVSPAFLKRAFAAGPITVVDAGPYGALQDFDANGISLPPGFTSREIARGGQLVNAPAAAPPYTWHLRTDGQATFPTLGTDGGPDGGWALVANSEVNEAGGGVSAVEFGKDASIERAYRILNGTTSNCAGGPTPWGTWLSCEEFDDGRVWECDPVGTPASAVARPALGVFAHEAACVDPINQRLYLTEDRPDGCWYRFTPRSYPDLSAGLLEVAVVSDAGNVTWKAVPTPSGGAANPTRLQVPEAAHFRGGEGTWYDDGKVYFTTKGDQRLWLYTIATAKLEILYDEAAVGAGAPLSGVDNITVAPSGDVYVCEDNRDHDICLITPDYTLSRFLTLDPEMHAGPPRGSAFPINNETVGVVFSPGGKRMYFGAQRSFDQGDKPPLGVVYEISGPFRGTRPFGDGGSGDKTPPTLRTRVQTEMRMGNFLNVGLPVRVDLGEWIGLVVRVDVVPPDGVGWTSVARAAPTVAVRGRIVLRPKPGRAASDALRGRTNVAARVTVTGTDAAGNHKLERFSLTLR